MARIRKYHSPEKAAMIGNHIYSSLPSAAKRDYVPQGSPIYKPTKKRPARHKALSLGALGRDRAPEGGWENKLSEGRKTIPQRVRPSIAKVKRVYKKGNQAQLGPKKPTGAKMRVLKKEGERRRKGLKPLRNSKPKMTRYFKG